MNNTSEQLEQYIKIQNDMDNIVGNTEFQDLVLHNFDCTPIVRSTILSCLEQILLHNNRLVEIKPRFIKQTMLKFYHTLKKPNLPDIYNNCILCVAHNSSFSEINGVIFNKYFDAIRHSFSEKNALSQLLVFGSDPKIHGPRDFLIDGGVSINNLIKFTMSQRTLNDTIPVGIDKQIKIILDKCLKTIAVNNTNLIYKYIKRNIIDSFACKTMFTNMLQTSKPKAIISTNYYSPTGWGLVMASKEAGIPYIEVQHGVQGKGHHAFNYPQKHSVNYNPIPNLYLTWTNDEKHYVENSGHIAQVSGPVWFQTFDMLLNDKKPNANMEKIRNTITRLINEGKAKLSEFPDCRHLLFIEQGNNSKKHYNKIKARLPDDIILWYCQRPKNITNKKKYVTDNADIYFIKNAPTILQLCFVDGIVSRFSSVAIEARYLGRQAFFIDQAGSFYFANENMIQLDLTEGQDCSFVEDINAFLKKHHNNGTDILQQVMNATPNLSSTIIELIHSYQQRFEDMNK